MRETIPLVMDRELPPVGNPYARTASLICGSLPARATGGCVSKNDASSSCSTAKSMPGATATTAAGSLSPWAFACTCTWLAYRTTWALVRMRLPSITTPEPVISVGACLVQGRERSGLRTVENTFTTAFSTFAEVLFEGSAGSADNDGVACNAMTKKQQKIGSSLGNLIFEAAGMVKGESRHSGTGLPCV